MENWTTENELCHERAKAGKVVLTVWLLDVHNRVVVLEEVDLLNVWQRLDTCKSQRHGRHLPNFLMADLSFLSSVT